MKNLLKKLRVLKDTGEWKTPQYSDFQNQFMMDINKVAKKYGYKQMLFAENDNEDRLLEFTKIK